MIKDGITAVFTSLCCIGTAVFITCMVFWFAKFLYEWSDLSDSLSPGVKRFLMFMKPKQLRKFTNVCGLYNEDSFPATMGSVILFFMYDMSDRSIIKPNGLKKWINHIKVLRNCTKIIRRELMKYKNRDLAVFIYKVSNGMITFNNPESNEKYIFLIKRLYKMCPYDLTSYWDVLYNKYLNNQSSGKEEEL